MIRVRAEAGRNTSSAADVKNKQRQQLMTVEEPGSCKKRLKQIGRAHV